MFILFSYFLPFLNCTSPENHNNNSNNYHNHHKMYFCTAMNKHNLCAKNTHLSLLNWNEKSNFLSWWHLQFVWSQRLVVLKQAPDKKNISHAMTPRDNETLRGKMCQVQKCRDATGIHDNARSQGTARHSRQQHSQRLETANEGNCQYNIARCKSKKKQQTTYAGWGLLRLRLKA